MKKQQCLGSLEPRLSVPDFVSQLWRKIWVLNFSKAARQNPEQKAWLRNYYLGARLLVKLIVPIFQTYVCISVHVSIHKLGMCSWNEFVPYSA